jgi:hypothetical protein
MRHSLNPEFQLGRHTFHFLHSLDLPHFSLFDEACGELTEKLKQEVRADYTEIVKSPQLNRMK